eukprot:161619_1
MGCDQSIQKENDENGVVPSVPSIPYNEYSTHSKQSTEIISVFDAQPTTCGTTCKQTETASNTSTDDTPQTQTQHDQGVVLCVWGFILIHMESTQQFQSNNLIPQAIKQLIVYFVGKLWTEFVYESDFDTNGICYAIASNYGQKEFS